MKKQSRKQGQAIVEMAIVLPILVLLLLGILQLGIIIRVYIGLSHSSRDAARAGAVGRSNAEVVSTAIDRLPELDPDLIEVGINPAQESARQLNGYIYVTVGWSQPLVMPLINNIIPNPLPMQSTTAMRIEALP